MSSSRVTDNMLSRKAESSMRNVRRKMVDDQERALTGKKVNRPSDDPQGAMRAIGLKGTELRQEQVKSNMEIANAYLAMADASLAELATIIGRAKELSIGMNTVTASNPDSQVAVASEIEQIAGQVIQLGNAKVGDRYIFGGFITNRPPFDEQGNYFGDDGIIEVEAQEGQRIPLNIPGMEPFLGVTEIDNKFNQMREQGIEPEAPAIAGNLREPASVMVENRGLDAEDEVEQKEIKAIQAKSGVNVFATLQDFASALRKNDRAGLQKSLDGLDTAFRQVLASRAVVGARQNAVIGNQALIDTMQVNNIGLRSTIEDADSVKVFSDLAKNETLLNSTLETNKKLLTPSLIDFLK